MHRLPDAASAPWRSNLGLRLLLDDNPKDITDLEHLCLLAAESDDGREQLATAAQERVFVASESRTGEAPFWIIVGFVLVGKQFETKLAAAAPGHPESLWIIRSLTQPFSETAGQNSRLRLSLHQTKFVLRTFGPIFPNTHHRSTPWGDQSDYDAALYLGGLVTAISTQSDSAAGECLARLLGQQDLTSYHPWISSRLSEQRELNRRSRYERPTWEAVGTAVKGGAPANMEDLKALFLAELWIAAKNQLERLYARDPHARGYGVYLVLLRHRQGVRRHVTSRRGFIDRLGGRTGESA